MSEQNKTTFRRMLTEVIVGGNLDLIDELVQPDFVNHVYKNSGEVIQQVGIAAFKAAQAAMHSTFAETQMDLHHLIAEEDRVVAHYRLRGLYTGEVRGAAVSSKPIHMDGITIVRFVDGKFAERWAVLDMIPMYKQLGALP
jgi:predicted ester cyclase